MGGHIFNIPGYNAYNKMPESWQEIIEALNRGTVSRQMPVGSQIIDTWRTYNAEWDVMHHFDNLNGHRAVALNWHYCLPDGIAYDAPEALYYCENALPAGTYHINIGYAYSSGWVKNDAIQFTLLLDIPAGGQICVDCATSNNTNPTAGRTLTTYAHKGDATALETTTTSNGTGGTSLGSTSTTSASRQNGNVNSPQRIVYGYNRWSQSAIRQYLNSAAIKGNWWAAQNNWDRPTAQVATLDGFLHDCTDDFLAVLQPVAVTTALNTAEGLSETSETTYDKIFLPSLQEMYITPQLAGVEGYDWDYNKALAQEAGLTGKFSTGGTYAILKKYGISAKTTAYTVWLRACNRSSAYYCWCIRSSGSVDGYTAYYAYRGCPACILQSS